MQNIEFSNSYLLRPPMNPRSIKMREGVFEGGAGRIVRITFCAPGEFRFRRIVTRSRMRPTGKFSSVKTGRGMQWESPHEKNAFIHLDFRCDVLSFREQACEIVYIGDDGNEAAHYPDIDLVTLCGPEIWEVKPRKYADDGWVNRRTEIMQAELTELGIQYHMKHAEELMREPQLSSMDRILRFGRRPVRYEEMALIRTRISGKGSLNWGKAKDGEYGQHGREILARLLLDGLLTIDLDTRLSEQTLFVTGPRWSCYG
jgi:hypothetical protein